MAKFGIFAVFCFFFPCVIFYHFSIFPAQFLENYSYSSSWKNWAMILHYKWFINCICLCAIPINVILRPSKIGLLCIFFFCVRHIKWKFLLLGWKQLSSAEPSDLHRAFLGERLHCANFLFECCHKVSILVVCAVPSFLLCRKGIDQFGRCSVFSDEHSFCCALFLVWLWWLDLLCLGDGSCLTGWKLGDFLSISSSLQPWCSFFHPYMSC